MYLCIYRMYYNAAVTHYCIYLGIISHYLIIIILVNQLI